VQAQSAGHDAHVSPPWQLPSPQPTHAPFEHVREPEHEPQLPPHPLGPHTFPAQFFVQHAFW
jgi:hypothetical protein